jgi:manganese transport protein
MTAPSFRWSKSVIARLLSIFPRTATAPFCPAEVRGSIVVPPGASFWSRFWRLSGPGLLVAVGYMDPGNWATDIAAGSKFGMSLLWVVLASSLAAMFLQTLSARLGLASGLDLARACRVRYGRGPNTVLWLMAEVAIVATDLAEVLGSALALHLLFGLSLLVGIVITAFDMLLVVGLQGRGFRQVEAIMLGLVITIAACFAVQLVVVGPDWRAVWSGFVPRPASLFDGEAMFVAIGILGATVMPHNLYLHSSIVQTRHVVGGEADTRDAIVLATADTVVTLFLALIVNAAILVVAASAFHATGHTNVTEIQDAYHLLDPLVGSSFAALLFGIGLLAAGQSSTFTGTIAGQVLMEGFLELTIPCWQRRVITRVLAVVPAFCAVAWLGEHAIGALLVLSQVVLSLQLPFAVWPLVRMTSDRKVMGPFASGRIATTAAYLVFVMICGANLWLLASLIS